MNQRELRPADVLFIPRPGRLLHETVVGPDGERVLTLFYDEKQITFDDPKLIPFGERLITEKRFVAEGALAWCADGYGWETVKELFEALLTEGVLELEDVANASAASSVEPQQGDRVVGSASIAGARTWTPDACLALSTESFRVPIEVGNLESLIRGIRIAHSALDVGGRQIGEGNVFPPELRVDLPTRLRACPYRGSRFQHEHPMNISGLQPIVKCWRDVLHEVRVLKRELWRRRPVAREGLSVVDLYVLGSIALCVPAFMMQRSKDAIGNGEVPLEISALFRVMDGTRQTTRDMLTSLHASFGPAVVPTADKLHHYADRELLLIAERGVCAGSPQMIDALLEVVVALETEAETEAATPNAPKTLVGDVETATRYGLAATELETIADQFWLRQRSIVDRLLAHLADRPATTRDAVEQALFTRLEASLAPDALPYLFIQEGVSSEAVYRNFSHVVHRCHEMRGRTGPPSIPPFDDGVDVTDPDVVAVHAALRRELPDLSTDTSLEIAFSVIRLRRVEEQTFPRMAERQAECNEILGRAPPSRAWSELDMATAWPRVSLRAALAEEVGSALDG